MLSNHRHEKPDLSQGSTTVDWSVELSEFDITFSPRGAIKSQILADFYVRVDSASRRKQRTAMDVIS
jgi:hypothetical protein